MAEHNQPLNLPSTHAKDRFKGRTIIITGGAGNIGRMCAVRMAKEGANVVIFDLPRLQDQMDEVVHELEGYGVQALGVGCDVTNEANVAEAVDKAVAKFNNIHYLFNNAGYQGLFTKTDSYPLSDFKLVMDINVTGVFNVLSAVVKHFKEKSIPGVIVNTASMAGVHSPPNMIAYATSKAAVLGMTRVAAKDLAPLGIRVNAISPAYIGPGFMWTRQVELQAAAGSIYFPADINEVEKQMIGSVAMRRYGTLEEVVGVATFLFSDDASYMTGENIPIHGGC